MKAKLTEQDFLEASKLLNCEIALIKAVTQIESGGYGFFEDDRPKILFEAHYFSKFTKGKYDKTKPNISSPTWNRRLYIGGISEYTRLDEAIKLDKKSALQSASWGMFQIMGSNYSACGFKNVEDFVKAMYENSKNHLLAFCSFLKSKGLDKKLIAKDWAGFALGYNGAGYKANSYDVKIKNAYLSLRVKEKIPSPKDMKNYTEIETRNGVEKWGYKV